MLRGEHGKLYRLLLVVSRVAEIQPPQLIDITSLIHRWLHIQGPATLLPNVSVTGVLKYGYNTNPSLIRSAKMARSRYRGIG